jgi:hypothetical protein
VELLRQPILRLHRLGHHLIHGVAIGAILLGETGVAAEDAGLPQHADIGGIDVLVGGEGDHAAVLRLVDGVGHGPHAQQIG